ncbi:MAG: BrnT family toxin [Candidatus Thiodiazotropha sp. (ex. Lucinisca nassula)]|uniref:BrnT family toxin n=1 Tax=Candidatus Thiodiazotropha sp. LNASS1 TaxID=3096260 RepID=UPI001D9CCFDE|nr:BrnT family toxin [Candidatus Thiodiazotropha sp. (ex. Lucinisca nassula)]MBW9274267.1 BrnT family toxin [Candidatus Thiodiazotropha sp. (ex. Lucinisca nassula)]
MIKFEWNSAKATANIKKHGISFEEAKSVFYDEFAVQFYDSENSELEEDRFLMLGLSSESRILIVCHCERDSGNTIRIISARKATSRERIYYAGDSS